MTILEIIGAFTCIAIIIYTGLDLYQRTTGKHLHRELDCKLRPNAFHNRGCKKTHDFDHLAEDHK